MHQPNSNSRYAIPPDINDEFKAILPMNVSKTNSTDVAIVGRKNTSTSFLFMRKNMAKNNNYNRGQEQSQTLIEEIQCRVEERKTLTKANIILFKISGMADAIELRHNNTSVSLLIDTGFHHNTLSVEDVKQLKRARSETKLQLAPSKR